MTRQMRIGLCVPQGYFNEYDGWDPVKAWRRTLEIAQLAERLGFESIWTGEHVTSKWGGSGSNAFDVWVLTTALAALVPNVEIGFSVINSTFHNPALTAKMAATLDVIADGRVVLGLGAGFRQVEADMFGFPYPPIGERLAILTEHFEIVTRALDQREPAFSFEGRFAHVRDLDNVATWRPPAARQDHGRGSRSQGDVPAGREVRGRLQPGRRDARSCRRWCRCSATRANARAATRTRSSSRAG